MGKRQRIRSWWRLGLLGLAITCCCLIPPSAIALPPFSPVAGSPFKVNAQYVNSDAFSPNGRLLVAVSETANVVSVFSVAADGGLTPASGSPYTVGNDPSAAAFSPDGRFLAVAASGSSGGVVHTFSVGADGTLSELSGSPVAVSAGLGGVAYNPSGTLLAVSSGNSVNVFTVGGDGQLTQVSGSPFAAGNGANLVTFSFSGSYLATANFVDSSVSMFSVASNGVLTQAPGSPFPTAAEPYGISFSPSGAFLATGSASSNAVVMFSVGTNGSLTQVPGSPFSAPNDSGSAAFSPITQVLASSSNNGLEPFTYGANGTLTPVPGSPFPIGCGSSPSFAPDGDLVALSGCGSVNILTTISAQISSPPSGSVYLYQQIPTAFNCTDDYGSGLSQCSDSNGASQSPGQLDTSQLGQHTYTVKAIANSGRSEASSISYDVVYAPPTATISTPGNGQRFDLDQSAPTHFTCAESFDGTGLVSCKDSNGSNSPNGHLDTSTYGQHTYTVTAVSADGQQGTANITYTVAPPGRVGVLLNNGDYATNSPRVTVDPVWPVGTTLILISNDGGFGASGNATTFPLAAHIPWKLKETGSDRLPKTVYVRFLGAGIDNQNFTDDIILDELPPTLTSAQLVGGGSAPDVGIARAKARSYAIRIKATDTIAGVCAVQASGARSGGTVVRLKNCRKRGILRLARVLRVRSRSRPRYARVKNSAGTWSRWRKVT